MVKDESFVSPLRKQGPITTGVYDENTELPRNHCLKSLMHGVWAPAFAGATIIC